ncbi:hypothetical protein BCR32DRAFT_275984 [Anaeromyces robustus]|uniref:Uncharacterized protein n=1 Tax=Anaeromyces robustus TaxID=1754192 RepID=A0A1Y1XKA2_9FUNG|nr:hypothetical protein BCR32DRAFT_275984 [Anaeromyces robustus]|eukprot:ORX85774.1 hypothetical protein BCR32DRAFT_275984 [Anaeromyces robustus]
MSEVGEPSREEEFYGNLLDSFNSIIIECKDFHLFQAIIEARIYIEFSGRKKAYFMKRFCIFEINE